MGLLDIVTTIQTGGAAGDPRGQFAPGNQGMPPIATALIGLLAAYAAKNMTGSPPTQPAGGPGGGGGLGGGLGDLLGGVLGGGRSGGSGGGGLGDLLGGLLGGGGGAGSALNGGLCALLKQLQQQTLGDRGESTVSQRAHM